MRGLAPRTVPPPARDGVDAATEAGWLDARFGLVGSVTAAATFLAVLAHAHIEWRSR
jgi:hypothetical protein